MILKSKPNSLQSKFLFVVIPSIIIVFAVQFVFWSIISYQAHVGELDENARKLSDSTAKVLSAPLWNFDDERIALVLSSIITDSDVHSAAVFDEEKKLISKIVQPGFQDYSGEKKEYLAKITFVSDSAAKQDIGYLNVTMHFERIRIQTIKTATSFAILLSVMVSLITGVIIWFFRTIIGKNIRYLNDAIRSASRRELNTDIQQVQIFEIDELVSSFNSLTQSQKDYEKQLRSTENELKLRLSELQATQEHLIETEKMAALGGLVAGIAHEINTPIGVSLTATTLLENEVNKLSKNYSDSTLRKSDIENFIKQSTYSAQIIEQNIYKASELISSFKQIAVDQTSDLKQVFNLSELLKNLMKSLSPKFSGTPYEVAFECDESIEIESFPGAISQVLTVLIVNSLTHGFNNKSTGQININCFLEHDTLIILYEDNGIGMSDETISKVFEPFYTTKRGQGGSGLGMSILYNLVYQKFNGRLNLESVIDQGIQVKIWIPNSAVPVN